MKRRKLAVLLKVDIEDLDCFKDEDLELLQKLLFKKHIKVESNETGKRILNYFFFCGELFYEHLILDQLEPYSLEYEILEDKIKQKRNEIQIR